MIPKAALALGATSVTLAGGAGFLTATAFSQQAAPTSTVTVDVGTGSQGPPGPPGPPGPKGDPGTGGGGAESCPSGSTFRAVRINTQGGHVTIWSCVAEP